MLDDTISSRVCGASRYVLSYHSIEYIQGLLSLGRHQVFWILQLFVMEAKETSLTLLHLKWTFVQTFPPNFC